VLIAQFSGAWSLRSLEAGWNANSQHHYHLGSDGCGARPVGCQPATSAEVFAETFELLAVNSTGSAAARRLIDSTPIPLGKLCDWATTAASAA
jgi:hypothetical protein